MSRTTEIVFRPAGRTDARSIAELHADSWRRHYRGAYSDDFLDTDVISERAQVWSERLSQKERRSTTILAEDGACLVGFVHLRFDEDPHFGSLIDNLHVTFDQKRQRIGSRLMGLAAEAAIRQGTSGLHLWVLEQNTAAQAFYEARGGRCAGRRLVQPPGGIPSRLHGTPVSLRYAWTSPNTLLL